MRIAIVAGARPNFMKIAPIVGNIKERIAFGLNDIEYVLVHTGQHYDREMSGLFFEDLGIPSPDINLGVGSGSHAAQTAEIMRRFEDVCTGERLTHLMVVGDVNSTIACALVASKLGVKVIHVEAGLRSFDRTMPEEINRVLTDAISDVLFTTEKSANMNLAREGIDENRIHFVGNVMIDTLIKHREKAEFSNVLGRLGLSDGDRGKKNIEKIRSYGVLTLHRPSNVDEIGAFSGIADAVMEISRKLPIIFPVHPRTAKRIKEFGKEGYFDWRKGVSDERKIGDKGIHCIDPLGYLDFLKLMAHSNLVLTDSGGIQEETTILGVPCVTMRENTERPVTVTHGTNVIAGVKTDRIISSALSQLEKSKEMSQADKKPPLWDGKASARIVEVLLNISEEEQGKSKKAQSCR
jgi:UDP-N-acetylglucosamine 2-epimerase (non-hydrolysing)